MGYSHKLLQNTAYGLLNFSGHIWKLLPSTQHKETLGERGYNLTGKYIVVQAKRAVPLIETMITDPARREFSSKSKTQQMLS